MPLKYQPEIDDFKVLINCPENVLPLPGQLEAFRLSFSPVGHALNFLPNVVFDKLTNSPFNYSKANDEIKCRRCAASYYTALSAIKTQWSSLTEQNRENLGYTHIAAGILDAQDGLMKPPSSNGHFSFYEFDTANLVNKFNLISEL